MSVPGKISSFLLFVFLSGGWFVLGADTINSVNSEQAQALLKQPKTLLLDVRTPEEYKREHIQGSRLIPLKELESRLKELPHGPDHKIVIHCTVGGRSARACKFLMQKGFSNVYNLEGGIEAWKAKGQAVVRP